MKTAVLALVLAQTPQVWVEHGNAAYAAGRYPEAALAYQNAVALRPRAPEALYDLGAALYRTADFFRALENFEAAALLAEKRGVGPLSRYNAGNAAFNAALTLVSRDAPAALAMLERSLAAFVEAADDARVRADALHNAEVVRKWLPLVEEEVRRQQSQAAGPPGPDAGGASPQAILGQESRAKGGGARTARPRPVDKDW